MIVSFVSYLPRCAQLLTRNCSGKPSLAWPWSRLTIQNHGDVHARADGADGALTYAASSLGRDWAKASKAEDRNGGREEGRIGG